MLPVKQLFLFDKILVGKVIEGKLKFGLNADDIFVRFLIES